MTLGSPLVRVLFAGSKCRPIGAGARCATADSWRRHFGWIFKGPCALRLSTPGGDSKPGTLVMSNIPLDLERRCEQRWAARFCRPTSLAAPQSQPQQQQQHLSEPAKAKRKTRRVKAAGLRSAPAA